MNGRNAEGYSDPTQGEAFRRILRAESMRLAASDVEAHRRVSSFMGIVKAAAELAGVEVVGRIRLKDKETGREFR